MIDRLVGLCLQKRYVVMVLALLAAGYGYYAWTQLKLEAYPDLGDVTAKVTTQAPGLAAEEVEQQTRRRWSGPWPALPGSLPCIRAARSACL